MSEIENQKATIIEVIPTSEFYFQRGITAFQKNEMNRAKKYFSRAVTLSRNEEESIFASCQLAICYQHTGEYDESIELLDELIEKSGDIFAEAYYFQANNYAFKDDLEKSLILVEQYLTLDPDGDFIEEASDLQETLKMELNDF
ncbi:tetratricopeptide repeat protein [Carnobacterium jeotgali]|uniref:tetratricopeptide repeat protein n=1 Tax=Carnobacterium jeotgali TaxID=545534 RepID=UPI003890CB53